MTSRAKQARVPLRVANSAEAVVPGRSRGIESVSRALDLLEALVQGECGLVELGRRTGLPPSTTHRLLDTLVQRGYVARSPHTACYSLAHQSIPLADTVLRGTMPLTNTVQPYMRSVQRVTGHVANLFVLREFEIVYVAQSVGEGPLASLMSVSRGRHLPAHATAAGKAMLAYTDPDILAKILRKARLEQFTPRTITDRDQLMHELDGTRLQGFAVGDGEWHRAMTCVAAPIFDERGIVVASLSVSAPTKFTARGARTDELGELVGRSAIEASFALGYDGPSRWHDEPACLADAQAN